MGTGSGSKKISDENLKMQRLSEIVRQKSTECMIKSQFENFTI